MKPCADKCLLYKYIQFFKRFIWDTSGCDTQTPLHIVVSCWGHYCISQHAHPKHLQRSFKPKHTTHCSVSYFGRYWLSAPGLNQQSSLRDFIKLHRIRAPEPRPKNQTHVPTAHHAYSHCVRFTTTHSHHYFKYIHSTKYIG